MRRLLLDRTGLCAAILVAILSLQHATACDCGAQLPPFSKEETEPYDLIFTGSIDSITPLKNYGIAWFSGNLLFKGLEASRIAVKYDNYTSCAMLFMPGERWLIYAIRDSSNGNYIVDYCGRSRKEPVEGEVDEYAIYSGIKYREELQKLVALYPPRDFITEEDLADIRENKKTVIDSNRDLMHATNKQKILFLVVSVVVFLVLYLVVKRFLK